MLVAMAIPMCPKESKSIIEKMILTRTVTPAMSMGVLVFSLAKYPGWRTFARTYPGIPRENPAKESAVKFASSFVNAPCSKSVEIIG